MAKKDKNDKADAGKKEESEEFKYLVRIVNTDLQGEKKISIALTDIKGVGTRVATAVCDKVGVDRSARIGDQDDATIDKIENVLMDYQEFAPTWMMNRRKDYDTGDDIHLFGNELEMIHKADINLLKKIRCYKGVRHENGLPVRGQRTRSNGRTGLTLGVSRKK